MKPFKFTKLRKRLFIGFLIFFLGPIVTPIAFGAFAKIFPPIVGLGAILFIPLLYAYNLLLWAPAAIFGNSLFKIAEFGRDVKGPAGWMVVVTFYVVVSFLLSWIGNLREDRVTLPPKKT